MGTYSHLYVGGWSIGWAKNGVGDLWLLFSKTDRKNIAYTDENNCTEEKPIYSRKLISCKKKLEFLGYDRNSIEERFNEFIHPDMNLSFNFKVLNELVRYVDVHKGMIAKQIINIIQTNEKYKAFVKEINSIEFIIKSLTDYDGYLLLMLLLINDVCIDEDVVWDYYDLVESGWTDESEIAQILEASMCLLITEGSSDTKILQSAFDWIYPDIADFFEFIDMRENYPFTGVGNLVNFYHGILKIGPSKNIVFIFDNDTEGSRKFRECVVDEQSNLRLLVLPNLPEFDDFETLGPSGSSKENINGKAVSIEMFLDLGYNNTSPPKVRWTSYDAKSDQYQGSLVDKKSYQKHFFTAYHNRDESYSLSKLKLLLDAIIDTAKSLYNADQE